jgi:hypothetical protein
MRRRGSTTSAFVRRSRSGSACTQFTCFTSTKVQTLTLRAARLVRRSRSGSACAQFTLLALLALLVLGRGSTTRAFVRRSRRGSACTQFTCFTCFTSTLDGAPRL